MRPPARRWAPIAYVNRWHTGEVALCDEQRPVCARVLRADVRGIAEALQPCRSPFEPEAHRHRPARNWQVCVRVSESQTSPTVNSASPTCS